MDNINIFESDLKNLKFNIDSLRLDINRRAESFLIQENLDESFIHKLKVSNQFINFKLIKFSNSLTNDVFNSEIHKYEYDFEKGISNTLDSITSLAEQLSELKKSALDIELNKNQKEELEFFESLNKTLHNFINNYAESMWKRNF